jgi:hypothetical protein
MKLRQDIIDDYEYFETDFVMTKMSPELLPVKTSKSQQQQVSKKGGKKSSGFKIGENKQKVKKK